jgi:excisionase family DNA binding protein
MDAKEVAELLAVSTDAVYRWAQDGKLPSVKDERETWFRRRDIGEFVVAHLSLIINNHVSKDRERDFRRAERRRAIAVRYAYSLRTSQEVGAEFGISAARVRQIVSKVGINAKRQRETTRRLMAQKGMTSTTKTVPAPGTKDE